MRTKEVRYRDVFLARGGRRGRYRRDGVGGMPAQGGAPRKTKREREHEKVERRSPLRGNIKNRTNAA